MQENKRTIGHIGIGSLSLTLSLTLIEVGDINGYFTLAYIFCFVCCIICVIYVYHRMYDNIIQISDKDDNSKIRVGFWRLICLSCV